MDSTPVNWEALDALVIEFAKSENLIEDPIVSSPTSSPLSSLSSLSSSSYHSRLVIRKIRCFLEIGDIDAAVDLLRVHAPFILDDHRLLFLLQKQKFVELLRTGTEEGHTSAINCLRTALAPCALDSYPEAYEEFKHVLLAFIYDKDDQTSPVTNEWSERRRVDIAGLVSTVLRAHLHAHDPLFSLTLRYLISIHKGFCLRQGISSPISDLNVRLLFEERDPPATPQESLHEAPPFDEVDVQALAHAVELTRQGAVDSLRFAKGDLFQAFQNELCRMKLNLPLIDELVHEYCIYRGLVDSGYTSSQGSQGLIQPSKLHQAEIDNCSSGNSSLEQDCGTKHSDGEMSIFDADTVIIQGKDFELRYPFEATTNQHDHCCTSGTQQREKSKHAQRYRSYVIGERNRRKRWKGRRDDTGLVPDLIGERSTAALKEQMGFEKHPSSDTLDGREDKYEIVLMMKELASKGMAAEAVEEINSMDPKFFVQNPLLLFQLKQVEFLKLVSSGDHSGALGVACSYLGPLASSDPTLLKSLKETLLALLGPNEDALGKGLPLHVLASSLQVAIGRRLGIEEPQLMKIMRATLHTHKEWFKLQMCKDRFECLLKIDFLKDVNTPTNIDAASMSSADTCTQGSSQVTVSSSSRMLEDGSSPAQVSSGDTICDENSILKVMEFLALPRADAIHLLGQYNGNAETVIQQIFA